MSMPFVDREFVFTQPNGKKFTVRGSGDQHSAVFRTPGGRPVVRDPASGYYEYALVKPNGQLVPGGVEVGTTEPLAAGPAIDLPMGAAVDGAPPQEIVGTQVGGLPKVPSRWETRRSQRRAFQQVASEMGIALAPPERKTVGTYVGLCLMIQFPDVPGTISAAKVKSFCNKKGYTGFGNNGSVRDYFFDVSGGKLTYTNIVAPYYTAKQPKSYYTDRTVAYPIRALELVNEALAFHKSNGFDFTGLTSDGDDYIYAINAFYAGAVDNNWSEGLWPHCYHLDTPLELAPGKFAYDYQITDIGAELSLGTFCHENGHMICDFPDLYDYDSNSGGVGAFCLMCAGANVDPKNPTHVGAYLKRSAGWVDSIANIGAGKMKLASGKNDFAIWRKNQTEYFIIENRAQAGRDVSLPGAGLAIWHIDELGNNSQEEMTQASHYECSLVQADGRNDIEHGDAWGDATDLFTSGGAFGAATTPSSKWWDGSASSLEIEKVSAPGASVSFTVK